MLAVSLLRRLSLASTACLFGLPAVAQTVETPTPPARVGQIARLTGDVSFNGAGSNGAWVAAQDNYPLTAGDSLYTPDGAEAAVALDSSRLVIAPLTEMQVTSLDDQDFTATQAQGEMFLNLSALAPGQNFTINTPGGAVVMAVSGAYDIISGPTTTVQVISGEATAGNVIVASGQAATLANGQAQVAALQEDGFMRHVQGELAPPPPPYVPQIAYQMTGIDELSNYGSWAPDPTYGAVWYPTVAPDWAPYRVGAWSYVAPWGWTWVEGEPWGFAPFHYGRWIHHDDRWGWVPAAEREETVGYTPVYAPAVVSFFGLAAGAAITADVIAQGNVGGRVGWVPLAPGEAYRPPYEASDNYIRRINRIDIGRSPHTDQRDIAIDHYANRAGATYAPEAAMARGERINRAGGAVPPGMLAGARPAGDMLERAVRPNMVARPGAVPRPAPPVPTQDMQRPAVRPAIVQPGLANVGAARPNLGTPAATRVPPLPTVISPPDTQPAIRQPMPLASPEPAAPRLDEARPAARLDEARPAPMRPAIMTAPAPRMEMPRIETPRVEMPRVETPPQPAPSMLTRPPAMIQAPPLQVPHVVNPAPFMGMQAPRSAAPPPAAPRPGPPQPPGMLNAPRPPG